MNGEYRFGIEEEYFLNDAVKRDAARFSTPDFFACRRKNFPTEIQREMLEPQVEIATALHRFRAAREHLATLRAALGEIARSTASPSWRRAPIRSRSGRGSGPPAAALRQGDARPADARQPHGRVRHARACGGADRSRVDLMNRMQPYLPLLLALSTSSPFWQAQRTGLLGYRLAAYRELPRTGLPDLFQDAADYQRYIDTLVAARAIENSSFVWWVIRPSLSTRRSSCAWPTAAPGSTTPSRSRPSTAASCAISSAIRSSTGPDRRLAGDHRGELLAGAALRHPRLLRGRGDPERKAGRPSCSTRCSTWSPTTPRPSAASASSTCAAGSSREAPAPTSSSPSTRRASAAASQPATPSPAWWTGCPRKPSATPASGMRAGSRAPVSGVGRGEEPPPPPRPSIAASPAPIKRHAEHLPGPRSPRPAPDTPRARPR